MRSLHHFALLCASTMAGALLDEAIAQVGSKQWNLRPLQEATAGIKACSEPITLSDFIDGACRPLAKGIKSIHVLFNAHLGIPSCGDAQKLGDTVSGCRFADLPLPLSFKVEVPRQTKMDFISHELQNGSFDVLKVLYLTQPISLQTAKALCSGNAFVPVFRPGPWNSKKAIQWLLSRLGGYQVRWHALQEKTAAEAQSQSDTPKWNPATHELEEGVALINEHAPDCDGRNEQALWILISIKADSGTPIAGWPEHKVRMMAQNKSRGGGGAVSIPDFPLTTFSLKPFVHDVLLPYLYPLLSTSALCSWAAQVWGRHPLSL